MKTKSLIFCLSLSLALFTSCTFMEGMGRGMASYMSGMGAMGAMGGYPTTGMYGSSVPDSWGNGYAGPMPYSSDPILNSTIGMAQTEARLQSQGVNTSSSSSSSSSVRRSSSSDNGWYKCCADVPNFGNVTYHTCGNCGKSHQSGSGHMCKKR